MLRSPVLFYVYFEGMREQPAFQKSQGEEISEIHLILEFLPPRIRKSWRCPFTASLARICQIECSENDECFLKQIAHFASPENIRKVWKTHLNALEKVLVARKDVNIPYEIIKLMEWFAFGVLRERVVEDGGVSEKMCVRYVYPGHGKEVERERLYPIQILFSRCTDRCEHVTNSPWMLFGGDY